MQNKSDCMGSCAASASHAFASLNRQPHCAGGAGRAPSPDPTLMTMAQLLPYMQ